MAQFAVRRDFLLVKDFGGEPDASLPKETLMLAINLSKIQSMKMREYVIKNNRHKTGTDETMATTLEISVSGHPHPFRFRGDLKELYECVIQSVSWGTITRWFDNNTLDRVQSAISENLEKKII